MSHTMYQPDSNKQVGDRIYTTSIQGLWYISQNKKADERGFFPK